LFKSFEGLGFDCPQVAFRQISGKLWEINIQISNAKDRIFYVTIKKDVLALLHIDKKQTQKAPKKEIELAKKKINGGIK
jgi:phage-related protein